MPPRRQARIIFPMPDESQFDVKLKSNGAYWQAWWGNKGEIKVKSLGAKSKLSRRQAIVLCRDMGLELRKNHRRNPGDVPRLSEWITQYKQIRSDVEPATMAMIDQAGRLLMEHFKADPTIDKISRSDASDWRVAFAAGELRGANVYPKPDEAVADKSTKWAKYRKRLAEKPIKAPGEGTVCKIVRCVKRMFAEAADEDGLGLIDRNPFQRLSSKAPKPAKNWATITVADLEAIRQACPNEGWRMLFTLCRLCGLRRGEALRLRWQDIDWARNRIVVNADIAKTTTKKARRVIPIEPDRCPTGLTAILRNALESAEVGAMLVCGGTQVENLDKDAKAIIARAGLAPYAKPFHTLRKNREGELARHYPQHVLKEWMGHDPEVADEHYLRVDEDLYAVPICANSVPNAQSIGSKPRVSQE